MIKWEHIVVHHSLTKDSGTVSWKAIRRYHTDVQGWSDIGYQIGVEMIGDHYEALLGRPLNKAGAHTSQQGMNRKAIGVCLIGNFDTGPPPPGMLLFTVKTVMVPMMATFGIPPENVEPHRKYATYKSCPGEKFPWATFINMIREHS